MFVNKSVNLNNNEKKEEILLTKLKYYKARYKGAEELCERYQKRLYNFQKQEDNLRDKIKNQNDRIIILQKQIKELQKQHFPRKLKRKQNKLNWAKDRLFYLEKYLNDNIEKQKRFEYLCNKWTGIFQKIHLANIKNEIRNERTGLNPPYYGFGDNREATIHIHKDNK